MPFPTLFQFHKGTIKTTIVNFVKLVVKLFQFHKGTIKTCSCLALNRFIIDFNSIKVQLRLYHRICGLFLTIFQFHKGTIKTPLLWDI